MKEDIERAVMDLSIVPNTADIIRDGGSYYCELGDEKNKFYSLEFPIDHDRLLEFENRRYQGEPFAKYKQPILYERLGKKTDAKSLSWTSIFRCLVKANPKKHYIEFPENADRLAEMIEVARRNMEAEGIE